MKNLLSQVLERTQKNVQTKTTKKNVCDSLHELLSNKQPIDRQELIGLITYERIKDEFPQLDENSKLTDEQLKRIDSINITVKNGIDTAVCSGKTPSSYNSNPKYNKTWKLIKDGSMISIVKK